MSFSSDRAHLSSMANHLCWGSPPHSRASFCFHLKTKLIIITDALTVPFCNLRPRLQKLLWTIRPPHFGHCSILKSTSNNESVYFLFNLRGDYSLAAQVSGGSWFHNHVLFLFGPNSLCWFSLNENHPTSDDECVLCKLLTYKIEKTYPSSLVGVW